ncbi:MAG: type II toxin-antitoxin system RelE/ParE family toxin [bacterium]
MEIRYQLRYHEAVLEADILRIDKTNRIRIKIAIESRLQTFPERYGKPLRSPLQGYWKLRVGDYRVVFMMVGDEVKIIAIQHRSFVYKSESDLKSRT